MTQTGVWLEAGSVFTRRDGYNGWCVLLLCGPRLHCVLAVLLFVLFCCQLYGLCDHLFCGMASPPLCNLAADLIGTNKNE